MGSTAKGLISGFLCRLCSKMNRYVILIYSEEGEKMGLADKINLYLPIRVTRNDPLPKTVCPNCLERLDKHSKMVQMIAKVESKFKNCIDGSENSSSRLCNTREERHLNEFNFEDSDSDGSECLLTNEGNFQNTVT